MTFVLINPKITRDGWVFRQVNLRKGPGRPSKTVFFSRKKPVFTDGRTSTTDVAAKWNVTEFESLFDTVAPKPGTAFRVKLPMVRVIR